jgi:hypothetical protein
MNKKSILAETLAEIKEIREGIEKNANHILKSTLKEDLEAIVRKGLNESEEEIQSDDMVGDGEPTDLDSEIENTDDLSSDDFGMDPTMSPEPGEPEVIDLTDEPFDKVSDAFERMQLTDEIEIVKTPEGGYQINIEPEGGEMGGEELPMDEPEGGEMGGEELPMDEPEGGEMGGEELPMDEPGIDDEDEDKTMEEEEMVFEIEMDENETLEHEEPISHVAGKTGMSGTGDHDHEVEEGLRMAKAKSSMKHNTEELHESLVATRKKLRTLMAENKNKTDELKKATELVEGFKDVEAQYKSAIKNLKGQLQEVALFTSNLTYAIKLMTENSTTKDEKLDILKRFDSAKTLTESREVFSSLETLFGSSKQIVEKTINERVLETPKASGSTKLNESSAYKNPQLERMLDIIGKIK